MIYNLLNLLILYLTNILFIFRKQEVQLTSNLFAVLGSKPNLSVHLDTLKWYTETKSMALIYVEEKLQSGLFSILVLRKLVYLHIL